jgi:predicted membrane chloride channel (bestrophin family)
MRAQRLPLHPQNHDFLRRAKATARSSVIDLLRGIPDMIQRPKLNWFRMLFVWHGSVLRTILPQLFLVLLISSLAAWTKGHILGHVVPLNVAPFTLIGVALALFLGFRNSASYDRFWEGRKIWGALLNVTRPSPVKR